MNYSPLTIHCASLCLDVIYSPSFMKLTMQDILSAEDEIADMVYERACLLTQKNDRERRLARVVAKCLVEVTLSHRFEPRPVGVEWLLGRIEAEIEMNTQFD
ncbi:hypothetical protein [uncultured Photobacterium sp.]|uniref:hypothetical protein n=1 Tax=uncultured Photobacterium sp. TaxID=173973 RepID=UPI0026294A70|nr:hypothetical protein [uncultured Photobacterium sp.]